MDHLTSVQLFIRVVESGSFSRTAQDMKLSQPTVTKHIAAIESRLGMRLLNRNTRGMRLTEAGAIYYERCKAIQHEIEAADELVASLRGGLGGTLRIAASVALGRRVIMPLALEFMNLHPGVHLDLQFEDAMVNLVERGIDVSVRMGKLADSSLGCRFLGVNPWATVASPDYLARHGEPQRAEDLARHPCIVYTSVQGDHLWHYTAEGGMHLAVPVSGPLRTNNLSCVLAAALDGVGVATLPRYVANKWIARGRLQVILADYRLPTQEIHAVYPSPKFLSAKTVAWVEFLQQRFAAEAWMSLEH